MLKIKNGKLITDKIETGKDIYLENGRIVAVTVQELPFDEQLDADGNYVSPGFVDLHTHGGGGYEFTDSYEDYVRCLEMHYAHGTTSIFPTCSAVSNGMMRHFLKNVETSMQQRTARVPHVLGAHLEGPYFSLGQCGAQNPQYIRNPDPAEYEQLLQDFAGVIRRWSFAPELPGTVEFVRALQKAGVVPAIAHTEAVLADVQKVYDEGVRLLTHFYSGMNTVTRKNAYRYLGAVEAGYLLDDMDVECIADGHHLPPELLRLIYKIKGPEHIALITDSIRGADEQGRVGGSMQSSESMGYVIKDGVAFLPDFSCFAGSVATADVLVRTMYKKVGVPLPQCIRMLCENPLRIMGVSGKGKLQPGYDADVVIFDEDIQIRQVITAGSR